MLLLERDLQIDKSLEKTHLNFNFEVNEDFSRLVVDVSFSPAHDGGAGTADVAATLRRDAPYLNFTEEDLKRALPLRNYVEVSLDSPDGWLGSAHRHGSVKHYEISESQASLGFRPAKLTRGTWVLTLSVHAVVTPSVRLLARVEGVL